MIAWLIYLGITVPTGFVLSFFLLTMRSTKSRGDGSPFPTIVLCLFLTVCGPFLFAEALTFWQGAAMSDVIDKTVRGTKVGTGKVKYFKVVTYTGSHARVIAVSEEKAKWGATNPLVFSIDLSKSGDKWAPDSYSVVYSDNLDKDGLVFPPYR